jgi:hypothetical protein
MKAKRLSLSPILPHRKSTFLFNPGEEILVHIKTICTVLTLQDKFGNDSKTFWFRFQNDIGTFLLSFLTLLAPGEASSDGDARAAPAPVRSLPTSPPSDDLKKCVKKRSDKRRPVSSGPREGNHPPLGWVPVTDEAVFAAVQRARLLERWPPFTQPSPPGLFGRIRN